MLIESANLASAGDVSPGDQKFLIAMPFGELNAGDLVLMRRVSGMSVLVRAIDLSVHPIEDDFYQYAILVRVMS